MDVLQSVVAGKSKNKALSARARRALGAHRIVYVCVCVRESEREENNERIAEVALTLISREIELPRGPTIHQGIAPTFR